MAGTPNLLVFREDLRLADNPALDAAINDGRPLICIFVYDRVSHAPWNAGGARQWWLHHSLIALSGDIEKAGGRLYVFQGQQNEIVADLVNRYQINRVFWNRRYAPYQIDEDKHLKNQLNDAGVHVTTCNGRLLFEPWTFKTGSGGPYRVFTPFWKALRSRGKVRPILPTATNFSPNVEGLKADCIENLGLLPQGYNWAKNFPTNWTPGEKGAKVRLRQFLDAAVLNYKDGRNRPDKTGTSGLSPHLQHGEISPVQIWHAVADRVAAGDIPDHQAETFLSEIAWREFSYVLLYDNPNMIDQEIRHQFKKFPWNYDEGHFEAWKNGRTGYPIVDAGMRQLWQTGWMHNRVRMIVASFLVKHLLIDWRQGMSWFWDTLVDADIAANTASWQWVAGCGADAAPYFRIFNPMTQGQKFDPNGDYIRKFVPELSGLPLKYLNTPWEAPSNVLDNCGLSLPRDYPLPIVDHKFARKRALESYAQIKS